MTRNEKIEAYIDEVADSQFELSIISDLIENELVGIEPYKLMKAIIADDANTVGNMVINRVEKRLKDYMVRTFNEWEGLDDE